MRGILLTLLAAFWAKIVRDFFIFVANQLVVEFERAQQAVVDFFQVVAVVFQAAISRVAASRNAKHVALVCLGVEYAPADVARVVTFTVKHGLNPFHRFTWSGGGSTK